MSHPDPKAPAGWYPDPSGGPGQRYFDGQQWTIMAPPPPPPPQIVINNNNTVGSPYPMVVRTGPNHALHLVLTIFTCGMWLPIWVLVAIFGGRQVSIGGQPGRSGGAVLVAVIGGLALIGLAVQHWQVFLALGVLGGVGFVAYRQYQRELERRDERAKIAGRAEEQNRAFMSGDDSTGIYGQYPPAPPPPPPGPPR